MPRAAWSAKRERQYVHIKSGLLQRGEEARAKGIAGLSSMNKAQLERALQR